MNHCTFIGRIATDIELKTTQSGISRANFRIAVDRRFKDKDGKRESDFISVVAWRQQAEFISRYGHKGDKIGISGSLQVRSFDAQDGSKRWVTEIVADEVDLLGSKGESGNNSQVRQNNNGGGTSSDFTEVEDEQLPF